MNPGGARRRARAALLVSPHLDDVAFSAGGTALRLVGAGWDVVLLTAFTRSVPAPTGFALACQLDKGLPPDLDYMALRRAEDDRFAAATGVAVERLDLPEAPHRGYDTAGALFGPEVPGDDVGAEVAGGLRRSVDALQPALVLAPQALGDHVDHRHVVRAVVAAVPAGVRVWWYRDTPYAMRAGAPAPPPGSREVAVGIDAVAKAAACAGYTTQLGFQFGGAEAMARALAEFASAEGGRCGLERPAEVFLAGAPPSVPPASPSR